MGTEINVSFPGKMKVEAKIGRFVILTDQSEESGGDGSAPTPFDLFAASIVTCAGLYVQKFCRIRSISTKGLELKLSYAWDQETKRYPRMTLQLILPEDFPARYHIPLLRSLDHCQVMDHIHHPPEFEIAANPPR